MALYFESRINKNSLLQTVFFGNFANWEGGVLRNRISWRADKRYF